MMRAMSDYTIMVGDTAYCAPSGWDWKKVCNALVEVGFKLWMHEKVRPECLPAATVDVQVGAERYRYWLPGKTQAASLHDVHHEVLVAGLNMVRTSSGVKRQDAE